MNARADGYRALQSPSMYRPWHQPLFGHSALEQTTRALRVMVWTDEAPEVGARLGFDVFRHDGSTVESLAQVAWVDHQPGDAPARYRLGLSVFAQCGLHFDELEELLAED
ncbi:MAG: hypothetical protein Q8L48_13215 [Archangium sp.]|nr:hypothetical protein [Archangium sp.]